MKLHRFFLADFRPALGEEWDRRQSEGEGVVVTIGSTVESVAHSDLRVIVAVSTLAELPKRDGQDRILIPERERLLCEFYTQNSANLIAVLSSCSRQLYSPSGCVALQIEDDREREYLETSQGIFSSNRASESAAGWKIEWTPRMATEMADRFDGIALLAEAFSGGGDANRYREFSRFLELAFRLPFYDKRLAKKLCQFLKTVPYGYDRQEINAWADLRHPATHADFKKSNQIALSDDFRSVVLRMQQACLDVLFNKDKWGDPGSGRRDVWRPDAYTSSKSGHIIVKQGTVLNICFRLFDEFGVHPVLLDKSMAHTQDNLYTKYWIDPESALPCTAD